MDYRGWTHTVAHENARAQIQTDLEPVEFIRAAYTHIHCATTCSNLKVNVAPRTDTFPVIIIIVVDTIADPSG